MREARGAGLGSYGTPSLAAVDARRTQLWTVAFIVMAGVAAGSVLLSAAEPVLTQSRSLLSVTSFRVALGGLAAAFALYAFEKELHLRRLTRLLIDERVLSTALSNRLGEVSKLSEAGTAVNAVLNLEETVDVILASALELLEASSGAVLLSDKDDDAHLRVLCSRGEPALASGEQLDVGHGVAGLVALTREPRLAASDSDEVNATEGPVMAVPLTHRDAMLGVLLVRRSEERPFSDYDLRVLTLFATHTASAVANASLYEVERSHVAELLELNRMKSAFVAMVSHELKSPLASIIGAVRTMQRHELPPEHVASFLEMIERQGERLSRLVGDVLELKKAEEAAEIHVAPVDAAKVARDVAQLSRAGGRPVELRAPETAFVHADPAALEQILLNLIDNAYIHGFGAVELEVASEGDVVRLSVLDRGAGVNDDDLGHIFAPFARGPEAKAAGSGLGLYLVKTLTEAQGGKVTASQRPGGGADFSVRMPAVGPVPAGVTS